MKLDKPDISILEAVQKDGRLSNRDLAKEVSLSPSPSWRRLRALEEAGVISHYAAVVDRHKVGLSIMGFAHVTLHDHSTDKVKKFDRAIMRRTTGAGMSRHQWWARLHAEGGGAGYGVLPGFSQ